MYKKYVVRLTEEQRTQLETLVWRGRAYTRKLLYARMLLKADADGPVAGPTRGSARLLRFPLIWSPVRGGASVRRGLLGFDEH